MKLIVVHASPWLDMLVALYYWYAFIKAEAGRYQEPTGKRHPRYQDRQSPILTIPWKTHYLALTALVFTWMLSTLYYHMHGALVGISVALLVVYMFVALWNGPMLQTVPTIEGVGQMTVAANLALYISVHAWKPGWLTLMDFTFGVILATIAVCTLQELNRRSRDRTTVPQVPPPPDQ